MSALLTLDSVAARAPDRTLLFDNLSLSIGSERVGLVGRNGSGKSTLMNIIAGEAKFAAGSVATGGSVGILAQDWPSDITVGSALGVSEALSVLHRIAAGKGSPDDFTCADWDLEQRISASLIEVEMADVQLDREIGSFSGGERTRIGIARLLIVKPDVLLLDEPTNNLDADGRAIVHALIKRWRGAVLVASHDRELLNAMDRIVELNPVGVRIVGGGWDSFVEVRAAEQDRAEAELERSGAAVRQAEQSAQLQYEKKQRLDKAGRAFAATGSQSAISLGAQAERAENSGANSGRLSQQKISAAEVKLNDAREKIEVLKPITIALPNSSLPSSADVLAMDRVSVNLGDRQFGPWTLKMRGPERVAIGGSNGSGKTTFMKVAAGLIAPNLSEECRTTDRFVMLDQHITVLDKNANILQNFRRLNPSLSTEQAHAACAHFAFRNRDTEQTVGTLSGGERLRAGLACTLAGAQPPWLLALDEPTNHLDIQTLELLERALSEFDGALLIVSHDQRFLNAIGVDRNFDVSAQNAGD